MRWFARNVGATSQKAIGIPVTPKGVVTADDTLTDEDAKLVRRGEAQLKRGKSKSWRNVKHEVAR